MITRGIRSSIKMPASDAILLVKEFKDVFHHLDDVLQKIENDVGQKSSSGSKLNEEMLSELREKLNIAENYNRTLINDANLSEDCIQKQSAELVELSESLKKEKEQTAQYRNMITSMHQNLSKKNMAIESLKSSVANLQKELGAATEEKNRIVKDNQQKKKKHDQQLLHMSEQCAVQKMVTEIAEDMAKCQIEGLNKELAELKNTLNASKTSLVSLNKAMENQNVVSNELAAVKVLMNDWKSKAGSFKSALETQKKELAVAKQKLAQLNGTVAEKTMLVESLQQDLAQLHREPTVTPSCSICASSFSNGVIVATKCGHIYHSLCLSSWFVT